MNCPDSIRAQLGMIDIPSAAATEGNGCHEAASAILEGETFSRATVDLTNEQIVLVEEYVSAVQAKFEALQRKDPSARLIVERKMWAPEIHRDYGGTGDCLMVSRRALYVDDLKCGWKLVRVRYENGRLNAQLASYVLLALADLGIPVGPWDEFDPAAHGIDKIVLTVHQPRVYDRPEVTTVKVSELREFRDEVVEAIQRIEDGDPTRRAGDWCHFCLAKGRCPTLRAEANRRAGEDFNERVENLPLERMDELLAEANWLEMQLKGAREAVFRALSVGRSVPGSKLVAKMGRKKWTDFDRIREIAADLEIPEHELYTHTPISPAQFITLIRAKKLGRKIDWREVETCFEKQSTGATLVPIDDPREAVIVRPGDDFPDNAET